MTSEHFADFLYRYRGRLFALWLLHTVALHVFVLGYMAGDGLSYRTTPVIELLQHGELGKWKYPFDWTLRGYIPFVELAHVPFLELFGLVGLLIGFPLVVFPLCVSAVLRLIRELTGDDRAALFGAFAYVAMPMVNAQAFAGLVDFAVAGILAFWLYALLRVRGAERRALRVGRVVVATVLLSMARQQGLYIALALFPFVAFGALTRPQALCGGLTVLVGSIPAIGLQVYRAIEYGSPIAPSELKVLGIRIADGVPMKQYLTDAGLAGDDVGSLLNGFIDGWIWKVEWPMGAFYHSQWLAAGFLTVFALLVLPLCFRRFSRTERIILVGLLVVSLLARDFALPRWAYAITIALTIVVGRCMSILASVPGFRRTLYWLGCTILVAQLARPEVDLAQIAGGHWISPRVNVAASPWFHRGPGTLNPYPDGGYQLAIIEHTRTGYTTLLFGRHLTNQVVGTVLASELGARCEGAHALLQRYPRAVFVDELDLTAGCQRTCVLQGPKSCRLYALH